MDPFTHRLFSSAINDDGRTFQIESSAVEEAVAGFATRNATWEVRTMMTGYVAFLAFSIGCAVHLLVLCYRSIKLLNARHDEIEVTAKTAPPHPVHGPPKGSPSRPVSAGRRALAGRPGSFAHMATAVDRAESQPMLAEGSSGQERGPPCVQTNAASESTLPERGSMVHITQPVDAPGPPPSEGAPEGTCPLSPADVELRQSSPSTFEVTAVRHQSENHDAPHQLPHPLNAAPACRGAPGSLAEVVAVASSCAHVSFGETRAPQNGSPGTLRSLAAAPI